MKTPIPTLIEQFNQDNDELAEWTCRVFMRLFGDRNCACLFLNTLSYMEHIGSYKIMATQSGRVMDHPTLKHLNEETGHAVLFKRHAERICESSLDYSESSLIASASARAYFSRLEAYMVRLFGKNANFRTIYLYMSLIVEFRAVWAYKILQQCVRRQGFDISLRILLAEEQGHLHSMARRLEADGELTQSRVRSFCTKERNLYVRLMRSIEAALDGMVSNGA